MGVLSQTRTRSVIFLIFFFINVAKDIGKDSIDVDENPSIVFIREMNKISQDEQLVFKPIQEDQRMNTSLILGFFIHDIYMNFKIPTETIGTHILARLSLLS